MAQANLRLAAGVGVMAVGLLVGGPRVAVAIAEPGGGSHSGHSDNGRGSDDSGRGSSRGGSDVSDNNVTNGNRSAQKSATVAAPRTKVGSGRDAGTSEARPGSGYSPDPPFKPPKVTFGDGRTPGVQNNDEPPRVLYVAPEPAPPPPPPPVVIAPAPSWVDRINLPPVVAQELRVRQAADLTDPMWGGVAGLLLIPATGAVLGYRQARAAQAAAELGRHP